MRIIILSPDASQLQTILKCHGYDVEVFSDPIDTSFLEKHAIDFAISYRYRHIIKPEIIDYLNENIINLHISYLPWNRGADPNLWSFLEDTPKGVSIHYIDQNIDTGDLIVQQRLELDEDRETLASTYAILNKEIIKLFENNLSLIFSHEKTLYKQKGHGSFHKSKDKTPYIHLLADHGWDTPVRKLKGKALKNSSF